MTKSARIKELVMRFLEDKKSHTISEIKQYVRANFSESFTEGQFSGSIDNLLKNRRIEKLDRGVYKILDQDNFLTKESTVSMRKCFVVSPIGDAGSI